MTTSAHETEYCYDLVNPRRACAARVTVLGLSVSVTTFSATTRNKAAKKAIPTGSVPHWLEIKKGDFRKSTAFKSYGVKTKRTSQHK